MTIGQRIEDRRKALGIKSRSELARRAKMPQTTLNGLINKPYRWSPHLPVLAKVLGTTVEQLAGEDGARDRIGIRPLEIDFTDEMAADQLDLVPIAEIDMAYGMGATFADSPVGQELLHFPRSFIDYITSSPAIELTLTRGQGDSMEPTIRDGEPVVIDRSQRSVRVDDLLWALTIGDIAMIKRLRVRGRRVELLSDNKDVPSSEADVDEINIVGRVIFVGRRL